MHRNRARIENVDIIVMSDLHLSVVIPAYNEEHRIEASIEAIADYLAKQEYASEIIVVDDGSVDETLKMLQALKVKYPTLEALAHEDNRGKGFAVRRGVLASKGNFILFSDADLNTPVEDVEKLFGAIDEGARVAIGSRAVAGAVLVVRRPWVREVGSRLLNLAIRLIAVPGIRDTQCGFKLFEAKAARDIFQRSVLNGFSFDVEILHLARRLGYPVTEVPVTWIFRGGSKVKPLRDGVKILIDTIRIRLHNYNLTPVETGK